MECVLTAVLCIKCVCVWCCLNSSRVHVYVSAVCCWLCAELTELLRVFVISLHWSWPPRWCPSRWERWRRSLCLIPSPCTTQMCVWGCQLPATCLKQDFSQGLLQTACVSITHHMHGLGAYLLDCSIFCCSGPTEAPFMYLYDYINVFIESRSVKLVLLSFLQKMWPTSFTTWLIPWTRPMCTPKKSRLGSYFGLLKNMVRWQTLTQHSVWLLVKTP